MDLEVTGVVWEWRGPAPYHFVTVPPEQAEVIADVAALYAGIDTVEDGGSVLGCESLASDPECGPMFAALGLDLAGAASGPQSFFRFEAR